MCACTKQHHGPLNPILTPLSHSPSLLSLFFCNPFLSSSPPPSCFLCHSHSFFLFATTPCLILIPLPLLLLYLCPPFSFFSCYSVIPQPILWAPSFILLLHLSEFLPPSLFLPTPPYSFPLTALLHAFKDFPIIHFHTVLCIPYTLIISLLFLVFPLLLCLFFKSSFLLPYTAAFCPQQETLKRLMKERWKTDILFSKDKRNRA